MISSTEVEFDNNDGSERMIRVSRLEDFLYVMISDMDDCVDINLNLTEKETTYLCNILLESFRTEHE